jgi:hypothetical protein
MLLLADIVKLGNICNISCSLKKKEKKKEKIRALFGYMFEK